MVRICAVPGSTVELDWWGSFHNYLVGNNFFFVCVCVRLQWIEVLGTTYKSGGIVVLSTDDDGVPTFGLISEILITDVDKYFMVCETLQTDYFCSHFHAFKISHVSHPSYAFVKQMQLSDYAVLGLYKSQYVVLKYHVK